MRLVVPERLTGARFAPFGEVVEHSGDERRRHLEAPFDADAPACRFSMWVSRVDAPFRLPLTIRTLERHRFAAQTFIPLSPVRYLVVVAPGGAVDHTPDLDGLRAFIAEPGQGVCYRKGTWHHGLTVLDQPGDFVVTMGLCGLRQGEKDDEFLDLPGIGIEIGAMPDTST
jgi:ureidoglycolate lyase